MNYKNLDNARLLLFYSTVLNLIRTIGHYTNITAELSSTRFGFTLSEVLITLGIIGIVAALTMPALVANYQEKVTITKLKKFYSVMSQAYQQALLEDDNPASWDLRAQDDPQGGLNFYSHLEPYLKITKYCGTGSGCWADTAYKYLNGVDIVNIDKHLKYVKFILSDGSSVAVMPQSGNCNAGNMGVCAAAIVDVNGSKPPNQVGKDIFHFSFTKDSVIATGSQQSTWFPFTTCAKESASNGWGCAAWVIYNENLDYLHCTGLSWGGKTKCD